jgi:hypothetical protein
VDKDNQSSILNVRRDDLYSNRRLPPKQNDNQENSSGIITRTISMK